MSPQIDAQSMTKKWLIAVNPRDEVMRDQIEPLSTAMSSIAA